MIVICDKCNTKYKLDDTTITEEGVKVRCSKCGNTFIVKKPKPEDIQKIVQPDLDGKDPGTQLDIHNDLDKAINETINTITSQQQKTPDTGTEFDWSDLTGEKSEGKEKQPKEEPAAIEWTPEIETPRNTGSMQPTDEVINEVPTEGPQNIPVNDYNEPKLSNPTVEHVVRESIKQGRSEYIPKTVLLTVKKIIKSLFILVVIAVAGYFTYIYRSQLLNIGANVFQIVSSYTTSHKPINIGVNVSDSRGYFLKNIRGQQLFVIEGNVTNTTEHPVSFIKLTANISDNNNNLIATKDFFAGNMLSDDDLRTLTSDQINSNLNNEMGQSLKNFNIPPKTSIPFMVVLFDVPDNITSFAVIPKSAHPSVQ